MSQIAEAAPEEAPHPSRPVMYNPYRNPNVYNPYRMNLDMYRAGWASKDIATELHAMTRDVGEA